MSARRTTDWDAKTYDRLAAPQEEWARGVLERLPLSGGETVLDAGCGSGRVTKLLLERLPEGRVIGVDGSPSMIEVATEAFGGEERVTLINSDLLELTPKLLREHAGVDSVDAVFSNATFHWIDDHALLFDRLEAVLRPGGRLVAQCGGRGNVAEWVQAVKLVAARDPFAEHIEGFEPWNFFGPEETEKRLGEAGFDQVSCWLEEKDWVMPEDPRGFVGACGLAAIRDRLPADLHERFTDAVFDQMPKPLQLKYVRLNLDGVSSA